MRLTDPAIIGSLYGLSELALVLTKRAGSGTRAADEGSLRMIWLVVMSSLALAALSSIFVPQLASGVLRRLAVPGTLIVLAGLALRWYSILYLGRLFTVNVAIAADHRVIDTGPYRYVRHPSYTGSLLAFLGLGILFGNWLSLLLAILGPWLAFQRRIAIEEAALSLALGDAYRDYMRRTQRLIPGVY